MTNVTSIIAEIDELVDYYLKCKSIFPRISDSLIGESSFKTAPYYRKLGYDAAVHLDKTITVQFIEAHTKVGNWINENAIIRLFGVLHYHGFVGEDARINQDISEWRHLDICRRIRNILTKTNINYEPNDPDNRKLRDEIISFYKLTPNEYEVGEIPTPTDSVVRPMFTGCKNYIRAMNGGE